MLFLHVFDLDFGKGPEGQSFLDDLAGVVGMDVDLDDLLVVHHHDAVADGFQIRPELQGGFFLFGAVDQKFGAVGKPDVFGLEFFKGGRLFARFPEGDSFPPEGSQEALQHVAVTLPAGVNHVGLGQDRILGGSQSESLIRRGGRFFQKGENVVPGVGGVQGRVGRHARNREDGALGGFHHRAVGGFHAVFHGFGQKRGVGFGLSLEFFGHAAEEERQDHPGVAPRAAQERGGDQGRNVRKAFADRTGGQLIGRGADGHGHIGTGIPVGDRENVQLVEGRFVVFDHGGGRRQHAGKLHAADGFDFHGRGPPYASSSEEST